MIAVVHHLLAAAFAVLMVVAAFEDLRRLTIPNWLTLSAGVLWFAYAVPPASWHAPLAALACALVVFAVGALLFARGYVGGGDVKLLAVAVLWAGAAQAPTVLILTGLFGGALALILVSPVGHYLTASVRVPSAASPAGGSAIATPVPYGVAIAAAALSVVLPLQFD